jgi:hypothetical protein
MPDKITIFLGTILIISIVAAGVLFSRSAIGKDVTDMFGLPAAMANALSSQINTCSSKGWFSVNKGCYIGFAGLGYVIISFLGSVATFALAVFGYKSKGSLSPEVERGSALQNKSQGTVIEETITDADMPKIEDMAESKNYTEDMRSAAVQKALTRTLVSKNATAIKSSSVSPDQIHQELADLTKSYNDIEMQLQKDYSISDENNTEIDNDLTAEGVEIPDFV